MGFKSLDQDFCYGFVQGIAQVDGTELVDSLELLNFRNKADESGVKVIGDSSCEENIFDVGDNRGTDNVPVFLKEDRMESVWPKCLHRFEGKQSFSDILVSHHQRDGVLKV